MYAAQGIPQIDTEIAQKGHFRMETIYTIVLQTLPQMRLLFLYVNIRILHVKPFLSQLGLHFFRFLCLLLDFVERKQRFGTEYNKDN